jgi:hypothetical protein
MQSTEVGEVQTPLNKKSSLKLFRAVNFISRFVMIIESINFEPYNLVKV